MKAAELEMPMPLGKSFFTTISQPLKSLILFLVKTVMHPSTYLVQSFWLLAFGEISVLYDLPNSSE